MVLFKMFCQQLFEAKVGCDDPLSDEFMERWSQLLSMLREARLISVKRCVHQLANPKVAQLVGFCDASSKVYAAMYISDGNSVDVEFLTAKTRVALVPGILIPQLELLSKLLTSIRDVLHTKLTLADPVCFMDSKATLNWI